MSVIVSMSLCGHEFQFFDGLFCCVQDEDVIGDLIEITFWFRNATFSFSCLDSFVLFADSGYSYSFAVKSAGNPKQMLRNQRMRWKCCDRNES